MVYRTLKLPRDSAELQTLLIHLLRRVRRQSRRIESLDLENDALEVDLHGLIGDSSTSKCRYYSAAAATPTRCPGLRSIDRGERSRRMEQAETGIGLLEIVSLSNGYSRVRLDSVQFELPPTLTHLLEILAAGAPVGKHGLVPMKSIDEVVKRLEQRLGRTFLHHTVHQSISRLRNTLHQNGLNPYLVQRAPDGARLAWRGCGAGTECP